MLDALWSWGTFIGVMAVIGMVFVGCVVFGVLWLLAIEWSRRKGQDE